MNTGDILVTLLAQEDPEPANGARARPGAVTTAQPQRVRFFEISSPHICPRFLNAVSMMANLKVRRGVVKKPAGKTVDGKELVIEEYPGLFGIAPFFGGAR